MLLCLEQLSSNDNNLYRPHEQQQQQQQQVKEEDDEFNVDIDVEKMTDNNKAAIHQALQSAAKRRVEFLPFDDNKVSLPIAEDQAGDTDFDHNIPLDFATNSTARLVMSPESITLNDLFLPPTPTYSSTYTPGSASLNRLANSVNNKTKDTSLGNRSGYLEEARKAYEDIVTGVYGMGLGDQDVLLLDDSNESRSNSYKSPNSTAVGGGHSTLGISALKMSRLTTADVIVEGDEEEAEKEDQLQEALTTGAPTNELADEWDSLPASAELSPQPHSHSFSHSAHSSSRSMTPHGATRIRSAALSRMPPSYFTTEMPNAHTLLYNAAFQYLCSQDLSQYSALISVREESPAKTSSWFGLTHKPLTFINASLHLEIPFLIAQLDYDPGETDHLHMLRCLYTFFTNLSCKASDLAPSNDSTVWNMNSLSSTGGHWETIGFQGLDPRTDLNRSMKMLSVLQVPCTIYEFVSLTLSSY